MRQLASTAVLFLLFAAAPAAMPQQPATQADSLGDAARQVRAQKEKQARTAGSESTNSGPQGSKSLADMAREQQDKSRKEVRTSLEDSKKLFASIDELVEFSSHDSGYVKHTAIRHQLLNEGEVIHHMTEAISSSADAQKLASSELVLKKFGFLPPAFDLKTFLISAAPKGIGAYYDDKTKMVNLLNWIEFSEQMPILAHELTHALQDQNYDLIRWMHRAPEQQLRAPKMRVDAEDEEEDVARRAVVEGQAEIVRYDYLLKPYERNLADTPQVMDFLQDVSTRTYDDMVTVHNAPLLLKETGIFPYREGLNFELELLRTGGKQMAFAGAFARPPRDTHEVLEPQAYIANQKKFANLMPDLTALLGDKYEAYDSGIIGQLDVRTMAKQFGREDDAFALTPNWQGGAYVAVKRRSADAPVAVPAGDKQAQVSPVSTEKPAQAPAEKPVQASSDKPASAPTAKPVQISTRDLALLYVSRWKTSDAAQRFLDIYQSSLSKRVTVLNTKTAEPATCSGDAPATCGPLWSVRVTTDEGPVFLEIWPKNLVFIAHSFDESTVARLRQAVLFHTPSKTATSTAELSEHLFELPEFQAFQEQIGQEIYTSVAQLPMNTK
ncbi:MAG TPA: hypothetical protein VFA71_00505 [Terriglobales bacterium]|nr:hypothetical protein [Terriglobales bacterium]